MKPGERVGENVRRERKKRDWSQMKLAEASTLHLTEISRIEGGSRDPRLSTIVKIARGLKIRPAELLDGIK